MDVDYGVEEENGEGAGGEDTAVCVGVGAVVDIEQEGEEAGDVDAVVNAGVGAVVNMEQEGGEGEGGDDAVVNVGVGAVADNIEQEGVVAGVPLLMEEEGGQEFQGWLDGILADMTQEERLYDFGDVTDAVISV